MNSSRRDDQRPEEFCRAVPLDKALKNLRRQAPTSVRFLHDCVQFSFGGAGLSAYTRPLLRVGGKKPNRSDTSFERQLRKQIGKRVVDTQVGETSMLIEFQGGVELIVPFGGADHFSPESIELHVEGVDAIWIA